MLDKSVEMEGGKVEDARGNEGEESRRSGGK